MDICKYGMYRLVINMIVMVTRASDFGTCCGIR
ncbi:hypothetical protein F383_09744 [Gossypium arboreum]|uniref:Uncharacterized protein n=1 Tax=Gossypium arboreum TaxID=29729 RepID=A0A0B0PST7_GOSAR|nr:hypothetical protein F383_09744 [Gossypium arboreum]